MTIPTHHPGEVIARNLTGYVGTILVHASRMDDPSCASEAFHQIRSSCKKIRAVANLSAGILAPGKLGKIRSKVSELKDLVARERDRDVLIMRLRELQPSGVQSLPGKPSPPATSSAVFPLAGDLARLIRELSLKHLTKKQVQLEISKTYSRASLHAKRCLKKRTDARLHEWRKYVKILQFQCGIFADCQPLDVIALRAALLARLLGDHQDLVVATEFLDRNTRKNQKLLKSLSLRKKNLADEAMKVGSSLFILTPREFAKGLGV